MRFAVTITGSYEVPDDQLLQAYGTTDPEKCAELDATTPEDVLIEMMEDVDVMIHCEV
jgi:hypothetical protein